MKYPTVSFKYDRRKKASGTRPGLIELEVSFQRTQKRFSTGLSVMPDQWDGARVINHPDSLHLNAMLSAVMRPVVDGLTRLSLDGEQFSWSWLADLMRGPEKERGASVNFREYVAEKIESRRDIRSSTRRDHRIILSALDGFKHFRTLADLTPRRIREFDAWLHLKGYKQTTVAKYHKIMKCYINFAIADELMDRTPYASVKIEKGKAAERRYLTEAEMQTIMDADIPDPSVARARDLFVFQAFTGMGYADLEKFDFAKCERRGERYIFRQERQKTGETFYIAILSPALAVLRKYGYTLPLVTNQKYNAALKSLGVLIGKRVTSHDARHTFATWCLNKGVSMETLAKFLGHSSTKSTQVYAKIVDKTIEREFDMLDASI